MSCKTIRPIVDPVGMEAAIHQSPSSSVPLHGAGTTTDVPDFSRPIPQRELAKLVNVLADVAAAPFSPLAPILELYPRGAPGRIGHKLKLEASKMGYIVGYITRRRRGRRYGHGNGRGERGVVPGRFDCGCRRGRGGLFPGALVVPGRHRGCGQWRGGGAVPGQLSLNRTSRSCWGLSGL